MVGAKAAASLLAAFQPITGVAAAFPGVALDGQGAGIFGLKRAIASSFLQADWEPRVEDFPKAPPVPLADHGKNGAAPTLADGPRTSELTFLHYHRDLFSVSGHDTEISDKAGDKMFHTIGEVWSVHSRTRLFTKGSDKPFAQITMPLLSWHRIFEVSTYTPICDGQKPYETVNGTNVYPFARITKWWSMWYSFSVETYNCDGSTKKVWDIKSRYWASMRRLLDVTEPNADKPVATIDQSYLFMDMSLLHRAASNYDTWLVAGEDLNLFAVSLVATGMSMLKDSEKHSSSSSSGHK